MHSRPFAGALRWAVFAACLVLPAWLWPHGWMFGYLAQTAALVVLALSYNLLLGTTGLLSFGHASFAGLGALQEALAGSAQESPATADDAPHRPAPQPA